MSVRDCNQLFLKIISKIKLYTDIYMHMLMMTHYLFQLLRTILVYFQHTFHSIFNETVSTFDHLLN